MNVDEWIVERFLRLDLKFWIDFQRIKTLDIYEDSRGYMYLDTEMVRNYIYENFDPICKWIRGFKISRVDGF